MKAACVVVLLLLCFVFPSFGPDAEAVSAKKVLIGAGMMAGGAILFASTFCWACDDDSGPYAGLALFGIGTGVVIWGLVSDGHHPESKLQQLEREDQHSRISFGVFPAKKGVQGGAVIRW